MICFVSLFAIIDDYNNYLSSNETRFVEGIEHNSQKPIEYFWYHNPKTHGKTRVGYANWLSYRGSLPKHWYHNNVWDLTYSDLGCAIYDLSETLKLHPKNLSIRSLETGLNIPMILGFNALKLTETALVFGSKHFEDMTNSNSETSIGKRCNLNEFAIKLYSKTKESYLTEEFLRYEVKVKKMNYLKRANIRNLEDLLDKNNLLYLKKILIENLEKIVFFDNSVPISELKPSERAIYMNWQSEFYRKELFEADSRHRKFNYQKQKFEEIIEKHGKHKIKPTLINQVSDKWNNLLES